MNDAKKIHPPETLEGWYALHQLFAHPVGLTPNEKEQARTAALLNKLAKPDGGGWSAVARVIGSVTDTMIVHFRPTLDAIGEVQRSRWDGRTCSSPAARPSDSAYTGRHRRT